MSTEPNSTLKTTAQLVKRKVVELLVSVGIEGVKLPPNGDKIAHLGRSAVVLQAAPPMNKAGAEEVG